MGKTIIAPLIYDGVHEWYIRFQISQVKGNESKKKYDATYLLKSDYTLEEAIEWRDNRLKYLEEAGLRVKQKRTITYKQLTTK